MLSVWTALNLIWCVPPQNLSSHVQFVRNGSEVYSATMFMGQVGVSTAMKARTALGPKGAELSPLWQVGAFSVQMNERDNNSTEARHDYNIAHTIHAALTGAPT